MKIFKRILTSILMLTIISTSFAYAATSKSSARQKAIQAYKKELTVDPNYKYFMLKDINKDGIPELLINEVTGNKKYAMDLITYSKGKIRYLYSSEVLENYYYSDKTKRIITVYKYDGDSSYCLYKINSKHTNVKLTAGVSLENGKYYDVNHKKITKAEFSKRAKSYMSSTKKLTFPYKNTKANRDKYLK